MTETNTALITDFASAPAAELALVPGTVVDDAHVGDRAPWSGVVAAGDVLTIVDLHGNQAVDTLFYAAADTAQRYSAQATIAAQGNIFLIEGSRHGLGKADLVGNVNFFMNVPVDPDGSLGIVDGLSAPGKRLALRAEVDTLVLISNCPQINNPCNGFDPTAVRVIVTRPS